jgi:hypothetical protein
VIALLLAARAAVGAGPGGFTFTPPPGWVDVSRGAPEAQRAQAPPALRAQADDPMYSYVAMDPTRVGSDFVDNMNVVVRTGARPPLYTPESLAEVVKGMEDETKKHGFSVHATRVEVVKVAGVTAGRVVADLQAPGITTKLVQYGIPGDMSHATLTYSTSPESFARNEPLFEASAQATLGAVEASSSSMGTSARIGAIAGAVGGAVGALLAARMKRRKQLQQVQRQPPPPAPTV